MLIAAGLKVFPATMMKRRDVNKDSVELNEGSSLDA